MQIYVTVETRTTLAKARFEVLFNALEQWSASSDQLVSHQPPWARTCACSGRKESLEALCARGQHMSKVRGPFSSTNNEIRMTLNENVFTDLTSLVQLLQVFK